MTKYADKYLASQSEVSELKMKLYRTQTERDNYRRFIRDADLIQNFMLWRAGELGIDGETISELNSGFDAAKAAQQQTPGA